VGLGVDQALFGALHRSWNRRQALVVLIDAHAKVELVRIGVLGIQVHQAEDRVAGHPAYGIEMHYLRPSASLATSSVRAVHDEVVAVQALDGVAPPGHGDLAPFGEQARVMAFGFGDFTHGVGKGQGELEVLEQENLFQLHHAVAYLDVPVGDLLEQHRQFFIADLRGIGAAGFAVGLVQGGHVVVS